MISDDLRRLREQRGLTLRAAGRAGGIAPKTLASIERGPWSPNVITLQKIARAYDIRFVVDADTVEYSLW